MSQTTRGDGGGPARTGRQRRPRWSGRGAWARRTLLRVLGLDAPEPAPADALGDARAMWQVCGITPPTTRGEGSLSRR